ncbi:hypothetical protein Nepgr_006532 [Nepenthes gracilis]|uniref:Uncharacterized protein n=1 Tax=Nepenthes gracilis TaxID=150966 RepID=A0AAD3XHF0_NEPGR|nr:hypothetical protein Nepgr_006532 [Nepenthes gracilis]
MAISRKVGLFVSGQTFSLSSLGVRTSTSSISSISRATPSFIASAYDMSFFLECGSTPGISTSSKLSILTSITGEGVQGVGGAAKSEIRVRVRLGRGEWQETFMVEE